MSAEGLLNPPRVPAETLRRQIVNVLTSWGMLGKTAEIAAEVMVETDLRGVDSHGINMLRQYDETFRRGALNVKAETKVLRERATTALLDADRGLGHPVSVQAMNMAIEKARENDVGIVCVLNSHHFGAAGYYAELAAKAGMIGIVTTSTRGFPWCRHWGLSRCLAPIPSPWPRRPENIRHWCLILRPRSRR
jgi:LDH2 family malate/lactate/ureidoglycolate dehydrogenase